MPVSVKPGATVFKILYELIGSLSSSAFNTLNEIAPSEHTGEAIVSDTTGSGLTAIVIVYGAPTHDPLYGVTVYTTFKVSLVKLLYESLAINAKFDTPFAIVAFVCAPVKPAATVFEILYELMSPLSSSRFNTLIVIAPSEHTDAAIVSDTTGSGLTVTVMSNAVPAHVPKYGTRV